MQIRINLPPTRPLTSSIPIRSSLIFVNSRYITEQIRKNSRSLHLFPLFSSDRVNYTTQPANIIPHIRVSPEKPLAFCPIIFVSLPAMTAIRPYPSAFTLAAGRGPHVSLYPFSTTFHLDITFRKWENHNGR